MKTLLIIDLQNDFIDGSLGTPEAVAILPKVAEKIKNHQGDIYLTRDTHPAHYLSTQEGKNLPVEHCIEGTPGWEISPVVMEALEGKKYTIVNKPTFGSLALAETLVQNKVEEAELIGLCTDICVVSNALLLKAMDPEMKLSVDAACCAGVTPQKHLAALETLRSCQVAVINA